jgi:hypothetical protein
MLAAGRDYRALGQPAHAGDRITLRATGITPTGDLPQVQIGGLVVPVDSVEPVAGMAGIFAISATVPYGAPEGDAVEVRLVIQPRGGLPPAGGRKPSRLLESNAVTLAIEGK